MIFNILIGFILVILSAFIDASEYSISKNYINTIFRYYIPEYKRINISFILKIIKLITCTLGYMLILYVAVLSKQYFFVFIFILIVRFIYILIYEHLINTSFII